MFEASPVVKITFSEIEHRKIRLTTSTAENRPRKESAMVNRWAETCFTAK